MSFNAFKKHQICLSLMGVGPPGWTSKWWLRALLDIYLAVQFFCVTFWAYLYFQGAFVYLPDSFMDRIVGVTAAISVLGSVTKLYTLRRKSHVLGKLYQNLADFPVNTSRGKLVTRVCVFFEVSVAMIIITHNMHIAIDSETHRSSPFWTASPTSGTKGEIVRDYIFMLDSSIITLMANSIGDTLFLTLINQICHRLLILANTVSSIGKDTRPDEYMDIREDATDSEIIKKCVEEHNLLFDLTMDIEDLYDKIILIQITYSFIDASLTLFTISQYEDFMEAMSQLLPQFIALFLELFLYCWGGQMIKNHFENLHFAVYDSEWFTLKKKDRTSILIMQTNSGKPVNLTSSSIFQLNFSTYETICKEVFSYYTVMRQFFSQK